MNLSLVIFSLVFILSLSTINVIALLALYSDHRHKDRTHLNGLLSTIILLVGVAGRQLITILRMSGLLEVGVADSFIIIPSIIQITALVIMLLVSLKAVITFRSNHRS